MTAFFDEDENSVIQEFLSSGYSIVTIPEMDQLNQFRRDVTDVICSKCGITPSPAFNLTQLHTQLDCNRVNTVRVDSISEINQNRSTRETIYSLSKKYIKTIVGNELAMQNKVNMSIQMPGDSSSILPLHSDVWSGNSPYEVVFWLPLVDCAQSQSMFVVPIDTSKRIIKDFHKYSAMSEKDFHRAIESEMVFLDVPYGKGVIFSHSILHGNILNTETTTRVSFNTRFKSLLSPYGTKELGESFLPITIRPATRIGFEHQMPEV